MKRRRPWISLFATLGIFAAFGAVALYASVYLNRAMRNCIVSSPTGAGLFMATNETALLNLMVIDPNQPPMPVAADLSQNGIIFVPNGTHAEVRDRKFFRDGRLVEMYPASSFQMGRVGAVEMERITITDLSHRKAEGWVLSQCLRRAIVYP